jgi:hypothetical protein
MSLGTDGIIDVECEELEREDDEDEDWDCQSTVFIQGGIGDGRIVLEASEVETGADCEDDEDDDDTITIDAVRR